MVEDFKEPRDTIPRLTPLKIVISIMSLLSIKLTIRLDMIMNKELK